MFAHWGLWYSRTQDILQTSATVYISTAKLLIRPFP